MHYANEPSIEELLELEEWNQHRLLRQEILAREIPWPGADQERGIIICGGGEKYLPGVWVLLRVQSVKRGETQGISGKRR